MTTIPATPSAMKIALGTDTHSSRRLATKNVTVNAITPAIEISRTVIYIFLLSAIFSEIQVINNTIPVIRKRYLNSPNSKNQSS